MTNRTILLLAAALLLTGCGSSPDASFTSTPGDHLVDDLPDAAPSGTGGSPSRIDSEGGIPVRTGNGWSPVLAASTGGLGGVGTGGASSAGAPGSGGIGTGGRPDSSAGGASSIDPMALLLQDRGDCRLGGVFPHVCSVGATWVVCSVNKAMDVTWCVEHLPMSTTAGWDWCCSPPQ